MTMLEAQGEGIPLPEPTIVSQPFWDGCARGELLFLRCASCGRALFNPTTICRHCSSMDLAWEQGRGHGTVYSWTVAWRPQHPSFKTPYAAVIVDLDEGYQMLSNVIDCEVEDLHVGMEVAVTFQDVGGGIHLPYFRPV
jgi:uncharacterized OB-fold protein